MRALALRIDAPMQSWGAATAGDGRPTLDFPTKSGVIGLVASALGFGREAISQTALLHRCLALIVRADRPGQRGVDFHTAQEVPRAERGTADTVVTKRDYLYDASFTVLLVERPGLDVPLETIARALRYPRFAPFLGRRACPPAAPLLIPPGIFEGSTWASLLEAVPLKSASTNSTLIDVFVEASLEPASGVHRLRVRDQLVGPLGRQFGLREVVHVKLPCHQANSVDPWFPR